VIDGTSGSVIDRRVSASEASRVREPGLDRGRCHWSHTEEETLEAVMRAADAGSGADFWGEDDVPLEELARRQGVRPIRSAADLIHREAWETDEALDAFLADLHARRRAGATGW
jgi:hypothetical protein